MMSAVQPRLAPAFLGQDDERVAVLRRESDVGVKHIDVLGGGLAQRHRHLAVRLQAINLVAV